MYSVDYKHFDGRGSEHVSVCRDNEVLDIYDLEAGHCIKRLQHESKVVQGLYFGVNDITPILSPPPPFPPPDPEMRYCEFSKEMSSLYCGLDVFCQFYASIPFDALFSVHCTLRGGEGGRGCVSNSGTLVLFRQNTAGPKIQ